MILRDYQTLLKTGFHQSFDAGNRYVLGVSPTGSGKTVVIGSVASESQVPTAVVAHRHELVTQISRALAAFNIEHNIIAADNTVKNCINEHIINFGRSFYRSNGIVTVTSVDTLIVRAKDDRLKQWCHSIGLWMIDECHHVLQSNKWGKAVGLFENARGIGFTATPVRADRKSLHAEQGGVFNDMIVGPSMRDLIDRGSLCDYRIFGVPQSFDVEAIKISKATGDFSAPSMRGVSHDSEIVGDIVKHYQSIAGGKQGITFVVDVEQAVETAKMFREAGVSAEAVSAKTPDNVRSEVIRKFANGSIQQLVNVDLFGEGFDVPAVEVVSMARPTQSYGLYVQQFGRALRTAKGKKDGIIIDHVGNVKRHGLPDARKKWDLYVEGSGKKRIKDPDILPVTICTKCFRDYEPISSICPHCGHKEEPQSRSHPKFVDGDLVEFSEELLAELRGEIERIDETDEDKMVPGHLTGPARYAAIAKWKGRQEAQATLRYDIQIWAGARRDEGMEDSEIYRRFYHIFEVDIATAQTLNAADASALANKIKERMGS